MTQRIYCKCRICSKVTMIKYQVGYASSPIVFTCPFCLTEIRGFCKHDDGQHVVHEEFENADSLQSMVIPDYFIKVSREFFTPHIKPYNEEDEDALSPFLEMYSQSGCSEEESCWQRAMQFADLPLTDRNQLFDYVQLWNNERYELLVLALKKHLPADFFPLNNRAEIYRGLRSYIIHFVLNLLPQNWMSEKKTFEKIQELHSKHPIEINKFAKDFEEHGSLKAIEIKSYNIIKFFTEFANEIIPIFSLIDEPELIKKLSELGISTVSYEKLKDFYQKSYELILDAVDILIALNNILYRGDYEKLPGDNTQKLSELKGNKYLKLQKYLKSDETFSELMEYIPQNRIRNSIGHYSAEFNGVTQQITFIDEHQGNRRVELVPLAEFALLCIYNFHTVFFISEIIYQLRKWYFVLCGDTPYLPPQIIGSHFRKKEADVGRNDPCPCGSGNKYKKCCLGKR